MIELLVTCPLPVSESGVLGWLGCGQLQRSHVILLVAWHNEPSQVGAEHMRLLLGGVDWPLGPGSVSEGECQALQLAVSKK